VTGASANGDGLLDLEAAAQAAATEAEGRPFTFAYKGTRFEVPPMAGWELATIRRVALGDLEGALGDLIGADYDRLCDAGLKLGELTFLFTSMGATQAAIPSLPNSARPARRGSNRTSKR
jgi:hypothetical protein